MIGPDNQQFRRKRISDAQLLRSLVYDALGRGDLDSMLDLTHDLLTRWPRERIQDSDGWYILAILSQIGSDTRRFGFAADEISRKVALTARLSYYRTFGIQDVICRTVALSAFADLVEMQVRECLAVEGHWGHYAASRLGIAAYKRRDITNLRHCLRRSRQYTDVSLELINVELEVLQLKCFLDILEGRPPAFDKLIELLRNCNETFQTRYYYTLSQLLDPEELQQAITSGRPGWQPAFLFD